MALEMEKFQWGKRDIFHCHFLLEDKWKWNGSSISSISTKKKMLVEVIQRSSWSSYLYRYISYRILQLSATKNAVKQYYSKSFLLDFPP
jgi:hypothetical protein